jgi:hypothetical protein
MFGTDASCWFLTCLCFVVLGIELSLMFANQALYHLSHASFCC